MIMLAREDIDERIAAIELIRQRIHNLNEMVGLSSSEGTEYDEAEETYDSLMTTQDGNEIENPRLWPVGVMQ
jgi:low affinity Fe/Cu permease